MGRLSIGGGPEKRGQVNIPFNRPYMTGRELGYIAEAHQAGHLAGNGAFTQRCQDWLQNKLGVPRAFLTTSCTDALEMAALLLDLQPGDEVIMPSFTFVSTANAFALRGAVPVFVDIRPDTLNLDESRVEAAITPRTRALVPVHYGGVACAMVDLLGLARDRKLRVVEDAAQALGSTYRDKPLGSFGDLAALSFHETKNVISGEGGALLVNDPSLAERADILWQKGTNRSRFLRGEVQKYEWVDLGSSFLPGEITSAFLWAQLESADEILRRRLALWGRYHEAFTDLERRGLCSRPTVPADCALNAHLYYLILPTADARDRCLRLLAEQGIHAVFHYVPLHDSPAGRKYGRAQGDLSVTRDLSSRLLRLPLWLGLEDEMDRVIETVRTTLAG